MRNLFFTHYSHVISFDFNFYFNSYRFAGGTKNNCQTGLYFSGSGASSSSSCQFCPVNAYGPGANIASCAPACPAGAFCPGNNFNDFSLSMHQIIVSMLISLQVALELITAQRK